MQKQRPANFIFLCLFKTRSKSKRATILWAAACQNQRNDLCTQQRLRLAWASAQLDQSSLCASWVAKDPRFPHANSKDWSDWVDALADLCLRWPHRSFYCFVMLRLLLSWHCQFKDADIRQFKENGMTLINIRKSRLISPDSQVTSLYWHTRKAFVVLNKVGEGVWRCLSSMMSRCLFDILPSLLTSFSAKCFGVNVIERRWTKQFLTANWDILV